MNADLDMRIRRAAFRWLERQVEERREDVLPWKLLQTGFRYEGERVPLVSMQGIFKPKILDLPLSIRTSPKDPYHDAFEDNRLSYRYRGEDPFHPENRKLREVWRRGLPLVYFFGLVEGRYLPSWPSYIVDDHPDQLTFEVAVDDESLVLPAGESIVADELRRTYATRTVQQRVHQRRFSERVLRAYREACAMCRLRHRELLDAAHIVPDREPEGEPRVSNGMALCKLHHAAFDAHYIGVRPDHEIHVHPDILSEEDGPMLLHGLKGLQGTRIRAPRSRENRPDPDLLEIRWERFNRSA